MNRSAALREVVWVANTAWHEAKHAAKLASNADRSEADGRTVAAWAESRRIRAERAHNALAFARELAKDCEEAGADAEVVRRVLQESAARKLRGASDLLQALLEVNPEWAEREP